MTLLKNINSCISPDLLKALSEMGHGDTILIADANYPSYSSEVKVIESKGVKISTVLEAILKLVPLDTYSKAPITLMMNGPEVSEPLIWKEFEEICIANKEKYAVKKLERFEFYEEAKKCYVIVATSDLQLYSNIILTKGVIN